MPFLTGEPIETQGRRFVDAGVSEPVPARIALAQNATHIMCLRTRRSDELVTTPSRVERFLLSRWLVRHAPGAVAPWQDRVAPAGKENICWPRTRQSCNSVCRLAAETSATPSGARLPYARPCTPAGKWPGMCSRPSPADAPRTEPMRHTARRWRLNSKGSRSCKEHERVAGPDPPEATRFAFPPARRQPCTRGVTSDVVRVRGTKGVASRRGSR